MAIILAYILMVLIGGIVLWIIAKLFSGYPPNIIQCFVGAGIAEFVSLFDIPFIPFIVLFIVLIKIGRFEAVPAFVATMLLNNEVVLIWNSCSNTYWYIRLS